MSGKVKGIVRSWSALNRIRIVSPLISSPSSSTSMLSPNSTTPKQRTCGAFHCSSVISVPSGFNHAMSGASAPPIARSEKNLRR